MQPHVYFAYRSLAVLVKAYEHFANETEKQMIMLVRDFPSA